MPNKIKHHYLPQFYLKGFSDAEGKIWVYKKSDIMNPVRCSIKNTACKNKLYYVFLDDHKESNMIEDWLAEEIEGPAAEPFRRLLNRVFPIENDKVILSLFFSTLLLRSPNNFGNLGYKFLIDNVRHSALNKSEFSKRVKQEFSDYSERKIEEMRVSIVNGDFEKNRNKGIELWLFLENAKILFQVILQLPWILVFSDHKYPFIVTDNSYSIFNKKADNRLIQLKTPKGFWIVIPLSKKVALMMIDDDSLVNGSIISVDNPIQNQKNNEYNASLLIETIIKVNFLLAKEYIFASERSKILDDMFKELLQKV